MRYINIDNLEYQSHFGIMGSESIVYKTNDGYFKKFNINMNKKTRENKELKLLRINDYHQLKNYYNEIVYMVNNLTNEYLAGYVVKKAEGLPLGKHNLNLDEKIYVLKKLRHIIEEFNKCSIVYSDIHFDNIYYNKNNEKITLIDVDNVGMKGLPIDLYSSIYEEYFRYGGHSFDMARIYAFNLISFMLLTNKLETYNISEINQNTYQNDYNFLNDDAKKICRDLLNIKIGSRCDNEYLIDAVNEKILIK